MSPSNPERATSKAFPVFDADSHVVEPVDVWERYLDPEFRVLGRRALWREHGEHDDHEHGMDADLIETFSQVRGSLSVRAHLLRSPKSRNQCQRCTTEKGEGRRRKEGRKEER